MVQFLNTQVPAGEYFLIPASQTNLAVGAVGAQGDYLAAIVFLGTGAATLKDGSTSLITFTASVPTFVNLGMYSKSGAWNITTATSTSVIAIGQFT